MRHRYVVVTMMSGMLLVLSAVEPIPVVGQGAKPSSPRRMPDGKPDLPGTDDLATLTPLVEASTSEGFMRADLDAEALVELIDLVWDGMGRRAAQDTFQTSYARVARTIMQLLLDGAVSPARRSELPNA